MIIAISGLDGAGKSTQIYELSKRLKHRNIKFKIIWARGGYTPLFEFLKKILRKITGKVLAPVGNTKKRQKQLSNSIIQKLWLSIAILDLFLLWGVYARLLSVFGVVVICDRFIQDTLLDFRRNFPDSGIEESLLWKSLKVFTPKPTCAFVLWIPVDLSCERSLQKGEPFPDDYETLNWRLTQYLDEQIFPQVEYARIDGRLNVVDISNKINNKIRSYF